MASVSFSDSAGFVSHDQRFFSEYWEHLKSRQNSGLGRSSDFTATDETNGVKRRLFPAVEPDYWWTDAQGRRRPGYKKKGGAAIAAVAVGLAVVGGAGLTTGGGVTGGSATSAHGKSAGKDAARKGQRGEAWNRIGLRQLRQTAHAATTCGAHSYGQVQQFFRTHPCRKLDRLLLAIGDTRGNTVVVSIAWVRMPSAGTAAELKELADTDGTGNVEPLAAGALGLTGVEFTGRYYGSRRDGSLVVIAEAAPGGGRPDPATMDDAAEVAAEFPPP